MIQITITNRIPAVIGNPFIVCGNSDHSVQFTFDNEWDGFPEKTACFQYFRSGTVVTEQVTFTGSVCAVPVITDTDEVFVGVQAGNIRTAAPARIPCARCITDFPARVFTPPEDVYNEITEALASHIPPQPTVTVILLRDAGGFGLRDCDGYALRTEG